MNHDATCSAIIDDNKNMLVPWYLMASYMYYDQNESILSDELFDVICKQLDLHWDRVVHWHKHLIDRASLSAGTCLLDWNRMPDRVKVSARRLLYKD